MIALVRDRTQIPAAFTGKGRTSNEALLLAQLPGRVATFQSTIWKKSKARVRAESNGKCAYCDSPTDVVAHGDVEHFRPKAVYWWLAYCYDNYLFACQICNQSHKGDTFPVAAKAMAAPKKSTAGLGPDPADAAAVARFAKLCTSEKALMIDPYFLDPEPLLKWLPDNTLREVSVAARTKSGLGRRRAQASIEGFGLNRQELRLWRFRAYETLSTFRKVFEARQDDLRDIAARQLKRAMEAGSAYAGMARYFVRDEWALGL